MKNHPPILLRSALVLALALGACANSETNGGGSHNGGSTGSSTGGSTGSPGAGGNTSVGGSTGSPATGGDTGSGGGSTGSPGTGGATALGGSTGSTSTGGSTGGGGSTGSGGTTASGGSTGGGGSTGDGNCATDTPAGDVGGAPGIGCDAPRPPKPTVDAKKHSFRFSAASLDPMANSGHQGDQQIAEVDTSKVKWKLCIVLPGIGGGPGLGTGSWLASQGYHVFQVAYDSNNNLPDNTQTDPNIVGNTRMEQFDGKDRTPNVTITRSNSIEYRTILALKHLDEVDPAGGWGWYLGPDKNSVRWSDGCAVGYSYGATHAAIISVYVRLGLVVSLSGPWFESHPTSAFLTTPSATPGNRAFAIFGMQDGRYGDYTKNAASMGWLGTVVTTTSGAAAPTTKPWYGGSHVIDVTDQGHTEFCASDHPYCDWVFNGAGR
ncbi:MAG TPA: hypothetical protein VHJ20_14785 [Polyangia bacterium]|nr:hypothetical protein [Polyangia bacterium]